MAEVNENPLTEIIMMTKQGDLEALATMYVKNPKLIKENFGLIQIWALHYEHRHIYKWLWTITRVPYLI